MVRGAASSDAAEDVDARSVLRIDVIPVTKTLKGQTLRKDVQAGIRQPFADRSAC